MKTPPAISFEPTETIPYLEAAYEIIFSARLRNTFLTVQFIDQTELAKTSGQRGQLWQKLFKVSPIMEAPDWAARMSELLFRSKSFQVFLSECIDSQFEALGRKDPQDLYAQYQLIEQKDQTLDFPTLTKARELLLSSPNSLAWVSLSFIAFARMLASSSTAIFKEKEWYSKNINYMKAEHALCMGEQKLFGSTIVSDLPIEGPMPISARIGENAPITLATAASVDIHSKLFRMLGAVNAH